MQIPNTFAFINSLIVEIMVQKLLLRDEEQKNRIWKKTVKLDIELKIILLKNYQAIANICVLKKLFIII